jgi:hypothetical protein
MSVRPVTPNETNMGPAFKAYLSFYKRTGYNYRKDRVRREVFEQWYLNIINYPKVYVPGNNR